MTDNEIVALFWERNEKAISAASEKYGKYCFNIAKNILQNAQDAEECLNDTCLRLWENIPPEKPELLGAFAAKIARGIAIDRYRREHAEKRGGGSVPLILGELAEVIPANDSVELAAERRELLAAIGSFLKTQPKRSRIIFTARYSLCESVKSIAERLNMTENNVAVSLSRTRSALREYLKKEGHDI